MKNIDPIERLLEQTPAPSVAEGPHREQLKQRLLQQSPIAQPRTNRMKISAFRKMSSLAKLATALSFAAVLMGAAWAGEKIHRLVVGESIVISHTDPSGNTTEFGTNEPDPEDKAMQADEEVKRLVAEKKYEFVRTIHHPQGGESNVYYFYLSDGGRLKWKNGPPRLEEVASWDEYQKKSKEYSEQRGRDIEKAIAGGKGRLINILAREIHVCRDVESNQMLDVRRCAPSCPEEGTDDFAYIYPGGLEEYQKPGTHMYSSSSWPDHLKAIRDGKRELLDLRIVKQGVYETTREDGSKLVFSRELPLQETPKTK